MKLANEREGEAHLSAEEKPEVKRTSVARVSPADKTKRIPHIGFAKGEIVVPDSFFEPLPEDLLRAFNGE